MERHYSLREAALLLSMHPKHIQKLDREGKIKCLRTIGNRRRIPESEIRRILSLERRKCLAIYARVSSHEQKKKGDLQRQIDSILKNFPLDEYEEVIEITDVSSGLNDNRKGLAKLISLAEEKQISDIVVTYPDRLTRFGFHLLSELFRICGVNIHVLNQCLPVRSRQTGEKETMEQELVKDMLAIVSSFSGKLYGLRSHKKKRIVDNVKQALKD